MRFSGPTYDAILRRLVGRSVGTMVPWFLMASYAYEELNDPFLTDNGFDWLCRELDRRWEEVDHWHKDLIDRNGLSAGTSLAIKGPIPERVKNAARHLMDAYSDPSEVGRRTTSDLDDLLGDPTTIDDLL